MADNLTLSDGITTYTVATDNIGGVNYERNKLSIGVDGVAVDASLTDPVPVAMGAQRVSDFREVPLTPATSGDATIIAGVANQTIRVFAWWFSVGGAVNVTWKDGTVPFHPAIPLTALGASWSQDPMGRPWLTTTLGNALVLNLSANVQVSGRLYYTQS